MTPIILYYVELLKLLQNEDKKFQYVQNGVIRIVLFGNIEFRTTYIAI